MKEYIAAIDQGTTSSRCILFDADGVPAALVQKEHAQICPRPGWVEHDALEIWNNCRSLIAELLRTQGIRPGQIASVGITNQRETLVAWNRRTGLPYGNAIVWQDTRTEALCRSLGAEVGPDRFRDATGLPLATYFSGPKIMWLLANNPDFARDAQKGEALAGTVDSWLVWNLSGGLHATDVTNASRTLLMNLSTCRWDPEILDQMGVPESILPRILPSSHGDCYGRTLASGPFGEAIPIRGVIGDQQGALVGQTCFSPGEAKNTYGTGCFMLLNTGQTPVASRHGLVTTLAYRFGEAPPRYALEGSVAVAGSLVQWLRDQLGLIRSSSEIEALAQAVPDNGGVYLVPAFSGLFAPWWRDDARGAIFGLTGFANRSHLARAALESTAFQVQDVLQAMLKDSCVPLKDLRVDGGMTANALLMQFQADVLGVPVIRPKVLESTALGAAYCAGLAGGFWADEAELRRHWQQDRRWSPSMAMDTRDHLLRHWKRAVERTFGWVEREDEPAVD